VDNLGSTVGDPAGFAGMRAVPDVPIPLRALPAAQEGAMTTAQARAAGLSQRQLQTLVAPGWVRLTQGVYIEPFPADPFRASVRAALLACPAATVCEVTAALMHDLWGLPRGPRPSVPTYCSQQAGRTTLVTESAFTTGCGPVSP
jgi:hypothetical protein